MKKIVALVLSLILLCSCSAQRDDYYVFSFDDFSLVPGYDDVEFMRLVFQMDTPEKLSAGEKIENIDVIFWDRYFASVDIENSGKKEIDATAAKVTRLVYYIDNYTFSRYALDGIELSESVKENCEKFNGEYVERNGYACAFGKKVKDKENIVILYGDILGIDQDKLDHLEIYVK